MFDGQSLMNLPEGATVPELTMADIDLQWANAAKSGNPFETRGSMPDMLARNATTNWLVMSGGTTDLDFGQTGASLLTEVEAYITARRAAGFDVVICMTMPPTTNFTAGEEAERLVYNAGLLTSSSPDAVVDVASIPELADPSDTDYFSDGTHYTAAAAVLVAAEVQATLATLGIEVD